MAFSSQETRVIWPKGSEIILTVYPAVLGCFKQT